MSLMTCMFQKRFFLWGGEVGGGLWGFLFVFGGFFGGFRSGVFFFCWGLLVLFSVGRGVAFFCFCFFFFFWADVIFFGVWVGVLGGVGFFLLVFFGGGGGVFFLGGGCFFGSVGVFLGSGFWVVCGFFLGLLGFFWGFGGVWVFCWVLFLRSSQCFNFLDGKRRDGGVPSSRRCFLVFVFTYGFFSSSIAPILSLRQRPPFFLLFFVSLPPSPLLKVSLRVKPLWSISIQGPSSCGGLRSMAIPDFQASADSDFFSGKESMLPTPSGATVRLLTGNSPVFGLAS